MANPVGRRIALYVLIGQFPIILVDGPLGVEATRGSALLPG